MDCQSVCVCVCVCGFAAQPEPSGHLVKRGCFMLKGHTHVRLLLKNSAPPELVYSLSQQLPSHNPTSVSPCPPFFPLLFFSPPLYTLIQWRNMWVTVRDKLRQRSEEGEICSCVVEQPISVKGNPPLSQRELHLLCKWSTRGLFLSRLHRPPSQKERKTKIPPPLWLSPHGSHPFHCFPFVTHLSLSFFFFLKARNTPE